MCQFDAFGAGNDPFFSLSGVQYRKITGLTEVEPRTFLFDFSKGLNPVGPNYVEEHEPQRIHSTKRVW